MKMKPQINNEIAMNGTPSMKSNLGQQQTTCDEAASENQNIIYAVNYSISSVDQFVVSARKSDWSGRKRARSQENTSENEEDDAIEKKVSFEERKSHRKSQRRKSKTVKMEKSRVRYDINLVPMVDRNKDFLQKWRDTSELTKDTEGEHSQSILCNGCQEIGSPFIGDESIVWIPSSRGEWDDCLSEMTAVCTSAALRRHVAGRDRSITKPFYAPLSQDYIRDRMDIDDPLLGYQIRHQTGGWLQGFIMFTNFTTWSHYFKWDSLHPVAGVQVGAGSKTKSGWKIDLDGSIANELEIQPRSGDPLAGGIVFESIAEIGLLGGLGCGEYLLRMALDDIKKKGTYKFVVLQATDSSRAFYERFGFIRVGAISRYGLKTGAKSVDANRVPLSDIVGYRHWTYAHESERSLGKHGGPSYMMALKLVPDEGCDGLTCKECAQEVQTLTDIITSNAVHVKPKITQLGSALTPGIKKKIFQAPPDMEVPKVDIMNPEGPKKRGRKKRKSIAGYKYKRKSQTQSANLPLPPPIRPYPIAMPQMSFPPPSVMAQQGIPVQKRRKLNAGGYQLLGQGNSLVSPTVPGKSGSYNQTNFQNPWNPVPQPTKGTRGRRASTEKVASSYTPQRAGPVTPIGTFGAPSIVEQNKVSKPGRAVLNGPSPRRTRTVTTPMTPESSVPVPKKREKRDNEGLRKQKTPHISRTFPREMVFFNKIVRLKESKSKKLYFVLHFDLNMPRMKLLPLKTDGILGGKRKGRTRYKVATTETVMIAKVSKYETVEAHAVIKTPHIDNEAYDILE